MFNTKPAVVERAEALLRTHCTAEQRANWEQSGWLWPIFGSEGGSFAFGTWAHAGATNGALLHECKTPERLFYQLWEYDPGTRDARFRWCVLPQGGYSSGGLPEYDCILGTKLLVEADEPAFRAIANRQWSRDGTPHPVPEAAQQAVHAAFQQMAQACQQQQQLAQANAAHANAYAFQQQQWVMLPQQQAGVLGQELQWQFR